MLMEISKLSECAENRFCTSVEVSLRFMDLLKLACGSGQVLAKS